MLSRTLLTQDKKTVLSSNESFLSWKVCILQLLKGQNIWEGIYFLYPRLARRPRAHSNLRPLERTKGLTWEPGVPAAPKWRLALRAVLLPWSKTVFWPVGALKANWSKVKTSPPAFKMRSRAFSVTCRAATCKNLISWLDKGLTLSSGGIEMFKIRMQSSLQKDSVRPSAF